MASCLVRAILPESDTDFRFLPAGSQQSVPAMLNRSSVTRLLDNLRSVSDLLLVVDPPISERGVSMPAAELSDAVFLVWDGDDEERLQSAAADVQTAGCSLGGVFIDLAAQARHGGPLLRTESPVMDNFPTSRLGGTPSLVNGAVTRSHQFSDTPVPPGT
jgi:hypothetical protein